MAPIRRHDSSRRNNSLWGALVAGVIFGLIIAMVHVSRSPAGNLASATASIQDQSDALHEQVEELEAQLHETKTERDAARRQLADQAQLQKDLEKKLAEQRKQLSTASSSSDCQGDRHSPWSPSAERALTNPDLAAFLKKVAIKNEVLVAVSNREYAWPGGMLELWMKSVKRAGVKNAMVIALDDDTQQNVEAFGLPAFRLDMAIPESQKDSGSNHAVSAMKFRILKPFLELGYGVLLSDVDIITLRNPFHHLVRDCDVESLSDGWNTERAYGYNDVDDDASMGWARYAHSMRIFVFNSGLFYLRPTQAALDLLDAVIYRVETEDGWDQALFNEVIFFPNSPNNVDPGVTRRVMNIDEFVNSKYFFKFARHDMEEFEEWQPVMIHVNYHPDKFERMKALWAYYVDGERGALDQFPDGSEK